MEFNQQVSIGLEFLGNSISRSLALVLVPGSSPCPRSQFLCDSSIPNLYLAASALNLYFLVPSPQFVFTGPGQLE